MMISLLKSMLAVALITGLTVASTLKEWTQPQPGLETGPKETEVVSSASVDVGANAPRYSQLQAQVPSARAGSVEAREALQTEVDLLRQELAAMRQDLAELMLRDASSEEAEAADDTQPSPEEVMAQHVADLERQFRQELRDDAWASASEALLAESFAGGTHNDSALIYADCRAKVCRIEVEHGDPLAAEGFQVALSMAVSDQFPQQMTHWVDDASGKRTLAFLLRD